MASSSGLRPGEALRLPSGGRAAVALLVERSFEAVRNVETLRMAGRGHGDGGGSRARAGAAQEKYGRVAPGAFFAQRRLELRRKIRIDRHRRKFLPFDKQGLFAEGGEIRRADIGPFGLGADVD